MRPALYFLRARYYNPILQRFISPDPLGFGGGSPNLYAYAFNSPTNFVDPAGLSAAGAALGAIGGLYGCGGGGPSGGCPGGDCPGPMPPYQMLGKHYPRNFPLPQPLNPALTSGPTGDFTLPPGSLQGNIQLAQSTEQTPQFSSPLPGLRKKPPPPPPATFNPSVYRSSVHRFVGGMFRGCRLHLWNRSGSRVHQAGARRHTSSSAAGGPSPCAT